MYWIKICSNRCDENDEALDYYLHDEPHIEEDLDEFFGSSYDMMMGPCMYSLMQKPVKSPPEKWLKFELMCAEMNLKSTQTRISQIKNALNN